MFGYVLVNKPELKIKDFEMYRSYYCGFCHTLKKKYGFIGRLTLNYDITFLAMVLSDLYDMKECSKCGRCIVHPFTKNEVRTSEADEYCADMCILLTYYKCLDDIKDEGSLKGRIGKLFLKKKAKRVCAEYPEKAELIERKLSELSQAEEKRCADTDGLAEIFGEIMAEVFAYRNDFWRSDLYETGLHLGKFIYILDAYEDVEADIKSGSFNPFSDIFGKDEFDDKALEMLMSEIVKCTEAFERLPLVENVEILNNILYSGVWTRYSTAKAKRSGTGTEKGK